MSVSLHVSRLAKLTGTLQVPGDKSMSHRAVMLAALAQGESFIEGFLPSEDCLATLEAFRACGVGAERVSETQLRIVGSGGQLAPPEREIDCGNSGTTMRLLSGILAGQPFRSRLIGDASLSRRPMGRILRPLQEMGASITAEGEGGCAPLVLEGGKLRPIRYLLPMASAQVKSAVLLAGMQIDGRTTVVEPVATRDHTERMLADFGVPVAREGDEISIDGPVTLSGTHFQVPGDISSAAFWLVAAGALPGSQLQLEKVGLNPTRHGILAVLERMGLEVSVKRLPSAEGGEPLGDLQLVGQGLRGTRVAGAEIPNVIDELPVLAVAGALASGVTEIRDAGELRVKESDRIHCVVENLRKLGAQVEEFEDGLRIEGGRPLRGAVLESFGDHRIAMAFAIAGLFAEGETTIQGAACIETSYPGFAHHLERAKHQTS
ncbi:MAG: 3-phosphoshikimate 1-carboxyvinyltransferase [Verrucomicrobiota bacterium]